MLAGAVRASRTADLVAAFMAATVAGHLKRKEQHLCEQHWRWPASAAVAVVLGDVYRALSIRLITPRPQSVIGGGPSVAQLAELGVQHTAIRSDAAMVVHVGELHSVGALLDPGVGDAAERCVLGLEDEFGHDNLPCVVLEALLVLRF